MFFFLVPQELKAKPVAATGLSCGPPVLDRSTRSARSGRSVRFPRRFDDFVPGTATALAHMPPSSRQQRGRLEREEALAQLPPLPERSPSRPPVDLAIPIVHRPYETAPDIFHVFRKYLDQPSFFPEHHQTIDSVCDAPTLLDPLNPLAPPILFDQPLPMTHDSYIKHKNLPIWAPFSTPTAALLMGWLYSGSNSKTPNELNRITALPSHPLYQHNDAIPGQFNANSEQNLLDKFLTDCANPFRSADGWTDSSVRIHLPCEKAKWPSEDDAPTLTISGVHHRRLINVIHSVFQESIMFTFHLTPFTHCWMPYNDEQAVESLYSEAYASEAMRDAHEGIRSLPRAPDDNLERIVAPLMLWSDSTHLAAFGTASVWPFYLAFGNQSKYVCGKPSSAAFHHVAYIPSVC